MPLFKKNKGIFTFITNILRYHCSHFLAAYVS